MPFPEDTTTRQSSRASPPFNYIILLALVITTQTSTTLAQDGTRDNTNTPPVFLNLRPAADILSKACSNEYRTLTGNCTNIRKKMAGTIGTPLFNYEKPSFNAARPITTSLKSAREISNIVSHQFEPLTDENYPLSEFATFFGQFVDHCVVGTDVDLNEPAFIDVGGGDDIVCDRPGSKLAFHRTKKLGSKTMTPWKRAMNNLPSALDLFGTYGQDGVNGIANDLRLSDGRMNVMSHPEHGDLLPLNTIDFKMNGPKVDDATQRQNFFLAGDHRSNENPVLASIHTLFVREHNRIHAELKKIFPEETGDWYYNNARAVNIARFQRIVYEEYIPAMTGSKLPPCRRKRNCYNRKVDPSVSDVFSTAAFRVGHSMVGPQVNAVDSRGIATSFDLRGMFFANKSVILKHGIDSFIRGAVRHQAQKIDTKVVSPLRTHLFNSIEKEEGVDLVALNIQRSRDHQLPPYVKVREMFTGERISKWTDITSDDHLIKRLKEAYANRLRKVEAWVGMMAEDHADGSPMGPTCKKVWHDEFTRLRDGDFFFYQNKAQYHPSLWAKYKPIRDIASNVGDYSMKRLIMDNTNVKEAHFVLGGKKTSPSMPDPIAPWILPTAA